MKKLKIFSWLMLAASVGFYATGIISGEFFKNTWGIFYYGTSMKSFWLTVMTLVCLLLAAVAMLIAFAIKRRKR